MWKRVLGVVLGVAQIAMATAHGFLALPAARNVQRNSDYCPHCLNGPRVCGDPQGFPKHEAFGKYANPAVIAARYRAGGLLKARVVITANHLGRWSLQLCALPNPSPQTERAKVPGCFRRLPLSNGKGGFVFLSSSVSISSATFRLPKGVRCKRCVVRWVYETSNSCNPKGMPTAYRNKNVGVCRREADPEQFKNCADIRIS